ncbi:MAG TPA: hypothetical protein VLW06_11765 [Terriglobales bacterium]|nr:hypothetical protein [Terriglobales bacterium]
MEFLKIWLLSIGAAITYGILHDQVTAHFCVEYFSIAHPIILPLTSPTLLALQWGILATWWVGAFLGLLLAISARSGSYPTLSAREITRPLIALLCCMGVGAFIAGFSWLLVRKGRKGQSSRTACAVDSAGETCAIYGGLVCALCVVSDRVSRRPYSVYLRVPDPDSSGYNKLSINTAPLLLQSSE